MEETMVRIRLAAVAAALTLLAARGAVAQGGGGGMGGQMAAMMSGGQDNPLFKGITLTDAELAKTKAAADKHSAALHMLTDSSRAYGMKMREARQSGDQAAADAAMKAAQPWRDKQQAEMKAFRDDLRAGLTAEHQALFDKNLQDMQAQMQNRRGGPGR
jgi:Spy/CpxP family protein refolding chaperone